MALRIYNSMTRSKEEFAPLHPGFVGIYVCGPTVYDHAHIGHAKSYISFDVVVRYLRHLGYKVRYVQNITDVGHLTDDADQGEDKIEKRARLERLEPMELVEKYARSYFEDMDALNVVRPDISPRASAHIPEQIALVERLLKAGHAYEVDGSVYFSVATFPDYGKLSGRRVEDQEAGARVEVHPEKRAPADFALWKRAEEGHLMRWNSPWGEGYPGWHTECSVMGPKYLGETLDIHGGGLENIFPHHECEIAQSEAATGKDFVRYWMHNNMVLVDGQKMGKSLGNFTYIKDALKEYTPEQLRFFVLTSHYRQNLNYTPEAVKAAGEGVSRIHNTYRQLSGRLDEAKEGKPDEPFLEVLGGHKERFLAHMDDDFNTAGAIGVLFDLNRDVNSHLDANPGAAQETLDAALAAYEELAGDILGILPFSDSQEATSADPFIDLLAETRDKLRKAKQWQLADEIRDALEDKGIVVEDTPDGPRWYQRR
jgi:cysteinyl-tRNA synthetase